MKVPFQGRQGESGGTDDIESQTSKRLKKEQVTRVKGAQGGWGKMEVPKRAKNKKANQETGRGPSE